VLSSGFFKPLENGIVIDVGHLIGQFSNCVLAVSMKIVKDMLVLP